MDASKLMRPIFYEGMFNRDGHSMRVVFERAVSNGTKTYRLWRSAGKPDLDYPRADNDKYILYVELNDYLAPLRMTDYALIDRCGYAPAADKLYGGKANRGKWIDGLRESGGNDAVDAGIAKEYDEVQRCGGDPSRQANYIQALLDEHVNRYLKAKENGGQTFPDFIGALVVDELANCAALSEIYKVRQAEKARANAALRAEEEKAFCAEQNKAAEQLISDAIQVLQDGGILKNEKITFYRGKYDHSAYSIVNYLMRRYSVATPLRTQGWINERLVSATIKDGKCEQVRYQRSKNGRCSQRVFECITDLIRAAQSREEAA